MSNLKLVPVWMLNENFIIWRNENLPPPCNGRIQGNQSVDAHKLDLEGQGIISNLDILQTYRVSDLKFGSDI